MEFTSKKIKIKEHVIHYIESIHSTKKDQNILCVHGLPGSCNDYRKFAGFLGNQYRIISIDLLGCGKSDKPMDMDYEIRTQAEYLSYFIDALRLANVVLIGHSYGGAIAQATAAKIPEHIKGLVLLASIGSIPHIIYKKLIIPMLLTYKLLMFPKAYHVIRPMAMVGFKKIGFPIKTFKSRDSLVILCKTASKINFKEIRVDAEKISCPTLYISCTDDPYVQPGVKKALQKKIRNFQSVEFSGDSHFLQNTHPEAIRDIFINFLSQIN